MAKKTVTLTFKFSIDENLIEELYDGDLESFGDAMENLMDGEAWDQNETYIETVEDADNRAAYIKLVHGSMDVEEP